MKKLMVAIAAIATAFGLYAADTGTSFESSELGCITNAAAEDTQNYGFWTAPASFDKADVTAYGDIKVSETDKRPSQWAGDQNKFIDIQTKLGNEFTRKANADGSAFGWSAVTNTIFFDSLVNFTHFDYDTTITNGQYAGAKIIIRTQLNEAETATNLVITAGNTALGGCTNYVIGGFAPYEDKDGWARLTIKAHKNIRKSGEPILAFEVFINGQSVTCAAAGDDVTALGNLTDLAAKLAGEDKLFLSMVQNSNIVSASFDGMGKVDDITFTTAVPFDAAKNPEFFYLDWDANVASITVGGQAKGMSVKPMVLDYQASQAYDVVATYNGSYVDGTWTIDNGTVANGTFTPAAGGATGQIVSQAAFVTITCTVGGTPTEIPAKDIADALGKIPTGATDVKFTLAQDCEGKTVANVESEILLDLNGHVYSNATTAAFDIKSNGSLTITDTSVADPQIGKLYGAITSAGAYTNVAGIIDGAINITGGSASITGGTFEQTITSSVGGFITGGYFKNAPTATYLGDHLMAQESTAKSGYYEIVTAKYAISYINDKAHGYEPFTNLEPTNYTYGVSSITLPKPTGDTGFSFSKWIDTDTAAEFVYEAGLDRDVDLMVEWTNNVYAVNYTLGGGSNPDPMPTTFTYNAEAQNLTVGDSALDGYVFKGWTSTALEITEPVKTTIQIPAGRTAAFDLVANWEAAVVMHTITVPEVTGASVEVFTNGTVSIGTAAGAYVVPHGTSVTVTYTALPGYKIDGTTTFTTTATGDVKFPSDDDKPTPYAVYDITITPPANGTLETSVTNGIKAGTLVTVTATPNTGYSIDKVYTNDVELAAVESVYSFAMPAKAVTVAAAFTANVYTISYELNGGEVATANPTTYTIESDAITLNNPTKTGYTFTGWTGTGIEGSTNEVIIAKGSTGDRSYTANYTNNVYAITVTPDSHGTITTDPAGSATMGQTVTVTVSVEEITTGYRCTAILTNGVVLATYTKNASFTMPAEAVTVSATYALSSYNVTVPQVANTTVKIYTNDVAEAAWTGHGEYPILHGTKVVVVYTADEGYLIEGKTTKSYPVNSVTEVQRIPAEGQDPVAVAVYDITITPPANGTLETSVTNGIKAGTLVTVTATPNTGYSIDKVYTNDVELAAVESVYSFEMPTQAVTVAAAFTANVYAVTYTYTIGGEPTTVDSNTNPTEYTYGVGATIDASKITKAGYNVTSVSPTTIAADATGAKEIAVVLESAVVHVTGVTLDIASTNVQVGASFTLTATVAPEGATDKSVTWTTSDEYVATVAGGVVKAVAAGSATITVKTTDGNFTATCSVTVKAADPGAPIVVDDQVAATNVINNLPDAGKAKYVKAPNVDNTMDDTQRANYAHFFKAVPDGDNAIKMVLDETKTSALKGSVDLELGNADILDASKGSATIDAIPGFYYRFVGGVEVNAIATKGNAVQATGTGSVSINKPSLTIDNKAFYKIEVSVDGK